MVDVGGAVWRGASKSGVVKPDPRTHSCPSVARAGRECRLLGEDLQLVRGDRLGAGGLDVDGDVDYFDDGADVAGVVEDLLAGVKARVAHAYHLRAYLRLLGVGHDGAEEIRGDPANEDGGHVVAAGNELVLGELHARFLRNFNVGVVVEVAVTVEVAPADGDPGGMDWSFSHVFTFLGSVEYDFSPKV